MHSDIESTYLPDSTVDFHSFSQLLHRGTLSNAQMINSKFTISHFGEDDPVEVPELLVQVLRQITRNLEQGTAVTITAHDEFLTTQQAADLLGISRPTLVKLLETGEIPSERLSHRRRVSLAEVLSYRKRKRADQYAQLLAQSNDRVEENPQEVLAELKLIRKELAAHRRQPGNP